MKTINDDYSKEAFHIFNSCKIHWKLVLKSLITQKLKLIAFQVNLYQRDFKIFCLGQTQVLSAK